MGGVAIEGASTPVPRPILPERYDLIEVIGSGADNRIWKANDLRTGEEVAIKVPRTERSGRIPAQRIHREAEITAEIRHPNIVRVLDVNTEGREFTPYLALEMVHGGTLEDAMRSEGGTGAEAAASVGHQLAEALGAVHDAGYVHRDVKPANVLVSPDGRIKLIDFGLAAPTDGLQETTLGGTPGYLPPEVAVAHVNRIGGRASSPAVPAPSADIYSAGLVVHEVTTGKPVFGNDVQALSRQERGRVDPLVYAPRPLSNLVRRMTAKDPQARPTAAEAASKFAAIASDLSKSSGDTPSPARRLDAGRHRAPEGSVPRASAGLRPASGAAAKPSEAQPQPPRQAPGAGHQLRRDSDQGLKLSREQKKK